MKGEVSVPGAFEFVRDGRLWTVGARLAWIVLPRLNGRLPARNFHKVVLAVAFIKHPGWDVMRSTDRTFLNFTKVARRKAAV